MSIRSKLFKRAKERAKKKGQVFTITEDDITLSAFCPILGIKLKVNTGHAGGLFDSPTLDRIDNSKGYVPGNVWVISQLANQMKSSANAEQLSWFGEWCRQNQDRL